MARYVVAVEGAPMADGTVIDKNALSPFNVGGVPVRSDDGLTSVGFAHDFQRMSDGNISFEFDWNNHGLEMDCRTMFKHIQVGQALWDEADGVKLLVSAVIYTIFVNDTPTPWDVLNHSDLNRS